MSSYANVMPITVDRPAHDAVDVVEFYDRLLALGALKGYDSLRAISLAAGLSHSALWKSKDGGNIPRQRTLESVATALDTTPEELMGRDGRAQKGSSVSVTDNIEALAEQVKFIVNHAIETNASDDAVFKGYAWLIIEADRLLREGLSQDQIHGYFLGATANGIPNVPEVVLSRRKDDHLD